MTRVYKLYGLIVGMMVSAEGILTAKKKEMSMREDKPRQGVNDIAGFIYKVMVSV